MILKLYRHSHAHTPPVWKSEGRDKPSLPDKNWGRELIHLGKQEDFDRLVTNPDCDIAIYGHIHQQFLRYGSEGQLILNPGSIGQPSFICKST